MKVVDISDELFRELGEPTSLSIPAITFWLRANIGSLGNYLNEDFYLNLTSLEIQKTVDDVATDIQEDEKDVLKKMYHIHYYDVLLRSTLNAASTDSVVEIQSDDTRVRRINKNELSKTYVSLKRLEQEEFHKLVSAYKTKKSEPRQVAGDDTVEGKFTINRFNRTMNNQ